MYKKYGFLYFEKTFNTAIILLLLLFININIFSKLFIFYN